MFSPATLDFSDQVRFPPLSLPVQKTQPNNIPIAALGNPNHSADPPDIESKPTKRPKPNSPPSIVVDDNEMVEDKNEAMDQVAQDVHMDN